MSVAQKLPAIDPDYIQECPLCGQSNRMVIKGVKHYDNHREIYPDIGYSFCNCKNIFYTNFKNVWKSDRFLDNQSPLTELKKAFEEMKSDSKVSLTLPDVFFCEWGKDPYEFLHWNPRLHHILWDMEQLAEEAAAIGFRVESCNRQLSVESEFPQTFCITLGKGNL